MTGKRDIHNGRGYTVLGIMSGTSLDGLDIAYCKFKELDRGWDYKICRADTIKYTGIWKEKLESAYYRDKGTLADLDLEYGEFIGTSINRFLEGGQKPDLIASHGHTVLHRPDLGYSLQVGDGGRIAGLTGITTIYDFRSEDIRNGGQGAPLVPVGDRDLFSEFAGCLNLGGFSNISFDRKGKRIAFDICPVNIILNEYAVELGQEFDGDGELGRKGQVVPRLLEKLNKLEYYRHSGPGSLGKEWLLSHFKPVLESSNHTPENILRTLYEHIAIQISAVLNLDIDGKVLVTGGGSHNKFLVELLDSMSETELIIPDDTLVNFKESLIFAYLGLLRYLGRNNCLASVTGARSDSMGGKIIFV